jgi:hypothetical protein
MMSLTDYGENWMLKAFKSGGTYYLGLFTSIPGEDGGGNEVSGGAYARQVITFGTPSEGSLKSASAIEFPVATALWGTIVAWALFTAASGGNMIWYGDITNPKEISPSDIVRFEAGSITLNID